MVEIAPGYRALRVLHRNGGVLVYDAWCAERMCRCIVKVVDPRRGDARDRAAVAAEARLLLSLAHPHIVRAYELSLRPVPALVLETLPGETLGHAIRSRGRLGMADVAQLGVQLCSALHYLHGRDMLHLDLKPSNIVCSGGVARIIDLGLARRPGRGHAGIGSAPYLAPEQARGDFLTAATDVFGLGATLYHAAAGRAPFHGSGVRGRYAQLRSRARIRDAEPRVSPVLGVVIDRCLDPDPSARPPIGELPALLRSAAEEERSLEQNRVARGTAPEEVRAQARGSGRQPVIAVPEVHEVQRRAEAVFPSKHGRRAKRRLGEVGKVRGRARVRERAE
jgi:serine/threonine protein kinase